MISRLTGKLIEKNPPQVVIDVNGVGYVTFCSSRTLQSLPKPGEAAALAIETYVREDAPDIWAEFAGRVARIEHAIKVDVFPKRPSGLCRRHCSVGRRLCEHCGK